MALKKVESEEFNKTIDELDNSEARHFSDVETDEDGIVKDVELLAGVEYKGELLKTFSFREMNGRDEEAINKADVRSNGGRLTTTLLERVVTDIGGHTRKDVGSKAWDDIIHSLLDGDLDYMIMQIRKLSKGNTIEFTHKCPNCGTKFTTEVDIDELEIIPFNGSFEIPFELPSRGYKDSKGNYHKTGTLRHINGLDREILVPLFKKNGSMANTMMLTRLIKFDDGAIVTQNNIANMNLKDRDYLLNLISDNTFGVQLTTEFTCDNCGEEVEGDVGISNFF